MLFYGHSIFILHATTTVPNTPRHTRTIAKTSNCEKNK